MIYGRKPLRNIGISIKGSRHKLDAYITGMIYGRKPLMNIRNFIKIDLTISSAQ